MMRLNRRAAMLGLLATLSTRPSSRAETAAAEGLLLGEPRPFSLDALVSHARAAAQAPYVPPRIRAGKILEEISFDEHGDIAYRPDRTLRADKPYPVRLFHLGRFFKEPVSIYLIEDGFAREVLYSPDLFLFGPKAAFARSLPVDLGFAGFRVLNEDGKTDWLAFLGASYFRTAGEEGQYGMSARGVAIDTALPTHEEFPRFTSFYIEEAKDEIVVHVLLDGPSITGAYRFRRRHPKGGHSGRQVRHRLRRRRPCEVRDDRSRRGGDHRFARQDRRALRDPRLHEEQVADHLRS